MAGARRKATAAGGRPKRVRGPEGGRRLRSGVTAGDLEPLNARIPFELMTELRVHCAVNRASIQNAVSDAIEKMLSQSEQSEGS
jgi:hypothetical protein